MLTALVNCGIMFLFFFKMAAVAMETKQKA
jgi:hypothetical protein